MNRMMLHTIAALALIPAMASAHVEVIREDDLPPLPEIKPKKVKQKNTYVRLNDKPQAAPEKSSSLKKLLKNKGRK